MERSSSSSEAGIRDPEGLGLVQAWDTVRDRLAPTPLLWDPVLSRRLDREVLLKLDNLQETGSFKVRGALARLFLLGREERDRGVVACSSGNHGRAVAWAAEQLGIDAVVCVPGWVDPVKRAAIERHGAEACLVGESYDEAEAEAERIAAESGRVMIHPFDDPAVVAGQGTIAMEILEARPDVDRMVAALSGGGLAAGMAYALRASGSDAELVAVTASRARVMRASLEAGHPVELPEEDTLASALAGGIGLENRVTFRLVRDLIHHHREVTEEEIAAAIRYAFHTLGLVVEGGGAVGLAAALGGHLDSGGGPLVVVVSGGNIQLEALSRILSESAAAEPPS